MNYDNEIDLSFEDECAESIDDYDKKKLKSLNLLAMNRRDKNCMTPWVCSEGKVFTSMDLNSAEPVIMLNISGDKMLEFFLYKARGIPPVWTKENVLLTDSMYITYASSTDVGRELLTEAWHMEWGNDKLSFSEQYLKDSDIIKKWLDKRGNYYRLFKQMTLALFYGLGTKGLNEMLRDAGYHMTDEVIKGMWTAFWNLFHDLNMFQKRLRHTFKTNPFVTNPLGFKLNTQEHKVLNAYVQSTVSSFISILLYELDKLDYATYIMTVHDEIIFELDEERIPEFIAYRDVIVKNLNDKLGFKYPLKLGCAVGKNFYDAH
jgi:hypothetical protein